MKASVILAHPYVKSFNHAIFATIVSTLEENNIETFHHDLYKENFDPVLTRSELGTDQSDNPLVNKLADELVQSDLLVFIHPNWWGQPPAILKGYIDRVIRPPYAYDFPEGDSGGGLPIGKLKTKLGVVYNTSNTSEERENNYFLDPLQSMWEKCVFGFLGIENCHRRMFTIISESSNEKRVQWLETIKKDIRTFVS